MAPDSVTDAEFNVLVKSLHRLNGEQKTHVAARLSHLSLGEAPKDDPYVTGSWLLAGLDDELIRRGLLAPKMLPLYLTRPAKIATVAIEAFLLKKIPSPLNSVQKRRFARLVARALLDWLAKYKPKAYARSPVNLAVSSIKDIPSALDTHYPGYLGAGLFGFVLKNAA